ncbi:MAG: glycosyltransferase [Actinomycetota bacterium]
MLSVLVISSGWPSPERPGTSIFVAEQVERLREAGVLVSVVSYVGAMDPRNYLRARRGVREQLRSGSFDVIHAHFGQSGLAVFPYAGPLPVVVTFHGSDLFGVVGRRGRYTLRGEVLRRISRWVASRANVSIVPSRRLAASLPTSAMAHVIPIGIDTTVFKPGDRDEARAALGWSPTGRYVLFGGNPNVPVKRYALAQEVLRRTDPVLNPELVSIVDRPRADVVTHLNAVDAILVTSQHESGPLIVKEAVACGTPVVSVDVGVVRELVGDLPGCVVSPSDDAGALAEALSSVLRERPRVDHECVLPFVDDRVIARQLIELYGDLLRSSRGDDAVDGER